MSVLAEEGTRVEQVIRYLRRGLLLHMGLLEPLRLGTAEILQATAESVLLLEKNSGVYMLSAAQPEEGERLLEQLEACEVLVVCQKFLVESALRHYGLNTVLECYQAAYLRPEELSLYGTVTLGRPTAAELERIKASYTLLPEEEVVEIYQQGALFGGYAEGELIGYVGQHLEGSLGLLEVFPEYRRKGYGLQLEGLMINQLLKQGKVPFGQIVKGNKASLDLQKKLGMVVSDSCLYWLS